MEARREEKTENAVTPLSCPSTLDLSLKKNAQSRNDVAIALQKPCNTVRGTCPATPSSNPPVISYRTQCCRLSHICLWSLSLSSQGRLHHAKSHDAAIAFILLADLRSRDPLSRSCPRSRAVLLQILKPITSFGEILCYSGVSLNTFQASRGNIPAALQYQRFASSRLAGIPMPTSVK